METIVELDNNENLKNKENISQGCQLQRFFRNKVYAGIEQELLIRKRLYNGINANGKEHQDPFYVNTDKTFRIEETLLIEKMEEILEAALSEENVEVSGRSKEADRSYFNIRNKAMLRSNNITAEQYKEFINTCLNETSNQSYENMKMKRELHCRNFKDIIEKIEVYETGIVCIFNNGFEMAVQF